MDYVLANRDDNFYPFPNEPSGSDFFSFFKLYVDI